MPQFLRHENRDGVAVLTISNPPVNALAEGVRDAVFDAVQRASHDTTVRAIVLVGEGSNFVAGADIRAFDAITSRAAAFERSEHVDVLLRTLEDAPKPIVAAIRGHALGGGLELAMACRYRLATADARLGQPEVTLGLIPGAGGTQRLPRLVDASLALRMCTEGKAITGDEALQAGLVDLVVMGDLLTEAIAFALDKASSGERRKTRDLAIRDAAEAGLDASRTVEAQRNRPGGLAAACAAEAVAAALTMTFDEGIAKERDLFTTCLLSTESRALRHLFFAERDAAHPPGLSRSTAFLDITAAAVVGAGTMGAGIAMCYASAGIPVRLYDVEAEAAEKAVATVRRLYEASVAKGRMSQAQCDAAVRLLTPTTTFDRFDEVDVVVEAAFEDMALKREIFARMGQVTHERCILASNTSTLDIDALADASGRPSHVVGHHFFSPANVMRLLEIVRGRQTSDTVIASSLAIGKRLGKVPVVVGNCFGFVANRMLAYYMREAYLLLEEGSTVDQIDRVMTQFGLPVGPFAMQDIAGIDVGTRIRRHLAAMGRTRADGPQSGVPDRLFDLGRYGQKTSAGWYRYAPGSRTPIPDPLINEIAAAAAAARGIIRRASIDDEEIVSRITTALANEGARVLGEGFANRAGDIDLIYCYGFGFPRYRGGPMFHAESVGWATVLERVRAYRATFGDYWVPAPLLERLVSERGSLYASRQTVA